MSPESLAGTGSDSLDFFGKMLVEGGAMKVMISLDRISTLDSMGIGSLIKLVQRINKHGGMAVVAHASTPIRSVFEKIKLEKFVKIAETEKDALDTLRRHIPAPMS